MLCSKPWGSSLFVSSGRDITHGISTCVFVRVTECTHCWGSCNHVLTWVYASWDHLHLVMRGHFGHMTKMSVTPFNSQLPKTIWCMQTSSLYVLQNKSYCRSKFYIVATGISFTLFCYCGLDLDPMTFTYESDPYSLELYRIYDSELWMSRLSKVIICQTYRRTDRHSALKL